MAGTVPFLRMLFHSFPAMKSNTLVSANPSAHAVSRSLGALPGLRLTQQGLDGAAALLEPVARVRGWEEDSRR